MSGKKFNEDTLSEKPAIEQVMYLDQRLKEHTLLQAIARTNRPYPRKNFGLVVDYVGVGKELVKALAIFDSEDLVGLFSVDDWHREISSLRDTHQRAMQLFKTVDRQANPAEILQKCLEILKPEDVRSRFEVLFREFAKSMDMLMPDPSVEPFIGDFKFLGMVREGARNLYRDERLSLENCSRKVEKLIHAHIVDTGIEKILEPIKITAPDFEEKLDIKGSTRAKASHVEQAIRETIHSKVGEDPHFYESLEEKLEAIIEEDSQRRKDEAELFKDLVELGKQEHFKRLAMLFPEKELVSGEQILLLGRKYRLKIKEENYLSIPKLSGRRLFICVHSNLAPEDRKEIIKDTLIKWYFIKSTKIIKQRITRYGKLLNLFPKKVIIKDQKKRWASCSSDGILRFNWRIAIAPISIVDYVVVHELCHLKVKNHSSDFWKLVSVAIPDYKKRKDWLKNNTTIFRL